MKAFRIEGTFMASDIDDAIRFLGRHFTALAQGIDVPLWTIELLTVRPLEAEDESATPRAEQS